MTNLLTHSLQSRCVRALPRRNRLLQILAAAALCLSLAVSAHAQFGTNRMQFRNNPALKPPAGAHVAIIEFDDLECPACAEVNPVLMRAVAQYKIPWIRHDFLIPYHQWSTVAAVNARWFDTKSKALGNEYRNAVFADQNFIYNLAMLSQFTDKFAVSHGVVMPDFVDPQNKFYEEVQADTSLARSLGLTHTPTIFIATDNAKGSVATEVLDPNHNLDSRISQAIAANGR
jgi:protein-disulfide isomerase